MCTNTKAEWKGFFKASAFSERHRKRLPHDAGHTDGTERACLVSSKLVVGWDMCLWVHWRWRGKTNEEEEEQFELQNNVGKKMKGFELAVKKLTVEIRWFAMGEKRDSSMVRKEHLPYPPGVMLPSLCSGLSAQRMQRGGTGHSDHFQAGAFPSACLCVCAHVFVWFQKVSENTECISLCLLAEAKHLWLERDSQRKQRYCTPPLQQLLPNTDRAPLCSRFTKVAISACSSAKRLAASGLHCNLVVMKAKKKRANRT